MHNIFVLISFIALVVGPFVAAVRTTADDQE